MTQGDIARDQGAKDRIYNGIRPRRRAGGWLAPAAVLGLLLGPGLSPGPADAESLPTFDVISGPVDAVVVRVIAGNAMEIRARTWLDQSVETRVHLTGISAPALGGRCERERKLANDSRAYLTELVSDSLIRLQSISHGSFPGWIVASVTNSDHRDLSAEMIRAGLAAPFALPPAWCGDE